MIDGDKKGEITHTHMAAVAASISVLSAIHANAANAAGSLNGEGNPAYDTLSAKLSTTALLASQIKYELSAIDKALPKALV